MSFIVVVVQKLELNRPNATLYLFWDFVFTTVYLPILLLLLVGRKRVETVHKNFRTGIFFFQFYQYNLVIFVLFLLFDRRFFRTQNKNKFNCFK